MLHKSATIRHAIKAEKAGVDLIEIVGYEASIAGGWYRHIYFAIDTLYFRPAGR